MWSAFGVCVNGSSQRWRENKSDPVHCVLGRSACLFGFLSLDHVLFFFEKGTAHADVVNYKAGLVRRACQFVCERVFAPHSVSSCLNVSMWVCSCVLGLSDLHTVLPALGKQNRVQNPALSDSQIWFNTEMTGPLKCHLPGPGMAIIENVNKSA